MSKIIAICNQKGGVGKTTLTVHLASYLYYTDNQNVIVVDADAPQHSLSRVKMRDASRIDNNSVVREKFLLQGRPVYDILNSDLLGLSQTIPQLKEYPDDTLIFIDLPGSINVPNYHEVISQIDYAIVPLEWDLESFYSTLQMLQLFDILKTEKEIPQYILWNKIKHSESKEGITHCNNVFLKFDQVKILETKVADSVIWKQNRSTIFPMPKSKNKNLVQLVTEIKFALGIGYLNQTSVEESQTGDVPFFLDNQ